jgi:hypothetical protein|tara:strand:+ start:383 stop:604 length:222 start_codon:yes stop_codon:yes gene_type:complete
MWGLLARTIPERLKSFIFFWEIGKEDAKKEYRSVAAKEMGYKSPNSVCTIIKNNKHKKWCDEWNKNKHKKVAL